MSEFVFAVCKDNKIIFMSPQSSCEEINQQHMDGVKCIETVF